MTSIAERHKYILDNINQKGFVKVADLAEALGVTPTTIRKDLNILESRGALHRAYGSALTSSAPVLDINLNTKRLHHFAEKRRIAQRAVSLVGDNDSVIISSGSTMAVFAENLTPKGRLNVVTPAVNIAMLLGDVPGITVMQLGGILYGNSMCVTGIEAINKLSQIHCSKIFFGVDGIDAEAGITCLAMEEADLTRKMIEVCDMAIVLADSSKIGFKGFSRICQIDEIDVIVTDSGISLESKRKIESLGVRVIVV
ncbi:MAG: DeoR/GlpR transcriptional regulator [Bacteroidales bacterium]|nr:DeoR/GlpR transcriptional regulator [Bacteroidales bacterium]